MIKKIKAQIWIETVIYILMGLSLMAIVLAFAIPKIEEQKDKLTVERTIEMMIGIENSIRDIKLSGTSATKENDIKIGKGKLIIDPTEDKLTFIIEDSKYAIGKPRESDPKIVNNIPGTNLLALSELAGDKYKISITLDYKNMYDIQYETSSQERILNSQPNTYRLMVENRGKEPTSPVTRINFYLNA
ncbi:MAG TPA: hypothetical protein P5277_02425 [Candidatus Paceibacterota bacterium]|nr:hypothetical protein [Candidatus Paceibacterota bacterium]